MKMTPAQAVTTRIRRILKERKITIYKLSLMSGIQPGTMANVMAAINNSVSLLIIMKVASALEMTLEEFFADELFNEENFDL
jgi:transcriptional regulator with XRE-family HTH domain